jgi:acetyl-CoA/propionyl-CoA carboxylase, biotin carboxylase, biotin carboxyl carrier protein
VLAAGVEPVPGTTEAVRDAAEVTEFGNTHGWPVAIKAAAGGGGRGIRVVGAGDDAAAALDAASREATAAFGSGACYLERFFERPRHVEVQILADAHGGIVHLGERDCSVQRRHQKLIEETPSPGLPAEIRERLLASAVAVSKACGYVGAGTVELLWDPDTGGAWFLEMNTRLQVEHPITEAVTGVDVVAAQFRIAAGEPLGFSQEQVHFDGHAIECRINAEDPSRGFFPGPGTIERLRWPGGPGVRVDAGYVSGDVVSPFYDDLLGKVIVHAHDRSGAIDRMLAAVADLEVEGIPSTARALARILDHPDFREARHWTTWLEERLDLSDLAPSPSRAVGTPAQQESVAEPAGGPAAVADPVARAEPVAVGASGREPDFSVSVDGADYPVRLYRHRPSRGSGRAGSGAAAGQVPSPLAGTLTRVEVAVGDRVTEGSMLAVVEAMKMETPVRAPFDGTVAELPSPVGGPVAAGQTIVLLERD